MSINKDKSFVPLGPRIKLGVLYGLATGSGMTAFRYVSAPTQILCKTIKILPGNIFSLKSSGFVQFHRRKEEILNE